MNQRVFKVQVSTEQEKKDDKLHPFGFVSKILFDGYLSEEDYHLLIDKCESRWHICSELVCNVDLLTESGLFGNCH